MICSNKIITKRDIYTLIIVVSLLAMLWGQILNQKVINANDCLMPVYKSPDAEISDKHFNYENKIDVEYWYLSDIIGWTNERISVGDLFVYFGLIFFIAYIILFGIDIFKSRSNSSPPVRTSDRKSDTKVGFNTDLKEFQK